MLDLNHGVDVRGVGDCWEYKSEARLAHTVPNDQAAFLGVIEGTRCTMSERWHVMLVLPCGRYIRASAGSEACL